MPAVSVLLLLAVVPTAGWAAPASTRFLHTSIQKLIYFRERRDSLTLVRQGPGTPAFAVLQFSPERLAQPPHACLTRQRGC